MTKHISAVAYKALMLAMAVLALFLGDAKSAQASIGQADLPMTNTPAHNTVMQRGSRMLSRTPSENVVWIVLDGVRWQEFYRGMDPELAHDAKLSGSWLTEAELVQSFGGVDAKARRERLMPFVWQTLVPGGVAFGNRDIGSNASVTNPYWFSYPGYNEMLSGAADPRVNSNSFGPNPNQTVFEYLNHQPGFSGKLGIYATWGEFHDIFNEKRSGLRVNAGKEGLDAADSSAAARAVYKVFMDSVSLEDRDITDSMLMFRLERDLAKVRPRLLFVGLGDSDNWAHMKRYDLVLDTLRRDDAFIKRLYQIYQKDPKTRNHTTFVITTDHGRGSGNLLWEDHGVKNPGSNQFWVLIHGPKVNAQGEVSQSTEVTQSQLARTVLRLLGDSADGFNAAAAPALAIW